KSLAFFLLLAESFILVHGFGYFINLFHILTAKKTVEKRVRREAALTAFPPVAIVVASYREPLEVVENTLTCFYNLTYPNKRLYFLDDTRYDLPGQDPGELLAYREKIDALCRYLNVDVFRRRWHGAKAGLINDFLDFISGNPREGSSLLEFSGLDRSEREKYLCIFDADMNPLPGFVEPLVAMMEERPKMAFIQTPQYYSNFEANRVAHASGLQQAVFYEYICEGKSLGDAMFCCGTNVMFRVDALLDVGKFDETSVTEDFATSLKFHRRGWSSAYRSFVCTFGMGPEDLGGYFKQQFRWALGTVGLFRQILGEFVRNPGQMSLYKWWEYALSGTHYFIGWALFTMIVCPILYLFLEVPSYFAWPGFYFLLFTPYILLSMTVFFWTLTRRNYRLRDAIRGQLLLAVTFPVYMKASFLAMLGKRGSFQVTPKNGGHSLPLYELWPQLVLATLSLAAVVWGINRVYYEQTQVAAVLANSFWCLYHSVVLFSVLYFNDPENLTE
ncbi:MAG TPA: glycosyltransferase family 2 protein, partial [Candidatus Ozemobacteraceae bacterium]|nr:glycosyltransferase family 2 protein [Candidatus Ozemobacteraceae bacterium]